MCRQMRKRCGLAGVLAASSLCFFFISFYFCTPRGEAVQGRPFEQLVCLVSLSLFFLCVCVNQLLLLHHTHCSALSSMILDG